MSSNREAKTLQRRRTVTHFTYQKKGKVSVFYYPHPDGNNSLIQEAISTAEGPPPSGWYFRGEWEQKDAPNLQTVDGPFLNEDQARITAMAWATHHAQTEESEKAPNIWEDRQKKRRL